MEQIISKYNIDLSKKGPYEISGDRNELARLFGDLGLKKGAEIGVEQGKFTKILFDANPGAHISAIDAWAAYKGYRDHVSQEKLDGFKQATEELLNGYNVEIIKGYSMDVVKNFEDESLDFVYIDGNHDFINVAQDIYHWHQKVKKGGIVSGHDYRRGSTAHGWKCDVKDVVQAWTYSQGIGPLFITSGERSPSWFYVK